MNVMTKEDLMVQAEELFTRGVKSTKSLLKRENIESEMLVKLEDQLESQQQRNILEQFINTNLEYIRETEKNHFIQGYLAAKGFEGGLHSIERETKKIVYTNEIEEGVTLSVKDMLVVGTGKEINL